MSEPDEQERLPFERSSIAAIGERRRWRLFGTNEDADAAEDSGKDDGPPVRSMLGALAGRNGPEPEPEGQPARGHTSMLALDPTAAPAPSDPPSTVPLTAHSTLAELAGLEERPSSAFPIERALLIAILLHIALVVVLVVAPAPEPSSANGGLFAALVPQDKDDSPIPVIFQDLPGQARTNPKRSPLSDADRRAAGGDPSRPKSDTPFVPPSRGVEGLAPGPRAPRVPGSELQARRGATGAAERRPAAEQDAAASKQASDFPTNLRPESSTGPREVSKLAGLDRAIQEAARGTVGGEGGSPSANPDGGFVDQGPLSFDTTWYDWGPYAAEMVRRIKLHWDVPELARLGWKGSLTVRFFILADGRVADAKIIRGSGIPPFDFAAFQAITKSSPFRPLPADLHEEREGVTVTFFYNMRYDAEEAKGTQ